MKSKIKIKYIFLSIVVLISFGITSYIVALVFQSGKDYVIESIIDEQNDHYNKMQKHIMRLESAVGELQGDVDSLSKKQLDEDDKKSLKKSLRNLEEIGLNISRETGFYQEDTTVHFFFSPRSEIIEYFDRTRNTHLYINRFVRVMENGLFENYINKTQKESIKKEFQALKSEIDKL